MLGCCFLRGQTGWVMEHWRRNCLLLWVPLLVAGGLLCEQSSRAEAAAGWPVRAPADLLDLHAQPASRTDRTYGIFFDEGAWQGYSLPARGDAGTGFIGPFLSATGAGVWGGRQFATIAVADAASDREIALAACDGGGTALPGALERRACGAGLEVRETLFFASAGTALVRVSLIATRAETLRVSIGGEQFADVAASGDGLETTLPGQNYTTERGAAGEWKLAPEKPLALRRGVPSVLFLRQTYRPQSQGATLQAWTGTGEAAWPLAGARWQRYMERAAEVRPDLRGDAGARRVSLKAVETLLANWRAPLGDLRHDGIFPSYSNPGFDAFWAWDSWKHAVALSRVAPELAKEQIRAMFDFQLADGMIPDKVGRDSRGNNRRDSKPPLATWAVLAVYRATGDTQFVAEMFDKLLRYHQWWYRDRDHDHDGLAEYGATDGTREAAGWESGMDNAVRFDSATVIQNSEGAWSFDQESVDLNCYLYQEKLELAVLADVLRKADVARQLRSEATTLRAAIQQDFFDRDTGYFFDRRLGTRALIRVYGPEGWIPLWTGVATPEQAQAIVRVLMNPFKFNTNFPFPTVAADDLRFTPIAGYWRGPVWIDQAEFAVEGLERYGFMKEAATMRAKLLTHSPGLEGQEPFHETYNPETGAGQNSRNFSWSAAHYFLLTHPRLELQGR